MIRFLAPAAPSRATSAAPRRRSPLAFGCAALAVTLALSACANRLDHLGKPPTMSPMTTSREPIDPNALPAHPHIPPVHSASLPPVPHAHAQTGAIPHIAHNPALRGADAASLWSAGPRSLLGDRRAQRVGDIVTILIEIDDEATIENTTTRSRSGTEQLEVGDFFGLDSIADSVLPGASVLNPAISSSSSSASSGDGEVSRNEDIDLRIAATVVQVLPNGNLVVTGNQEVRVNFELRDLQVAGVIRPEDITRRNTITYDKIANARISYGGRGQITDLQQPRYGQQIVDMIAPF